MKPGPPEWCGHREDRGSRVGSRIGRAHCTTVERTLRSQPSGDRVNRTASATITLWHFDAGAGAVHHIRFSRDVPSSWSSLSSDSFVTTWKRWTNKRHRVVGVVSPVKRLLLLWRFRFQPPDFEHAAAPIQRVDVARPIDRRPLGLEQELEQGVA